MNDSSDSIERVFLYLKNNIILVLIFFSGMTLLGIGLIQLFGPKDPIVFESEDRSVPEKNTKDPDFLTIQVDIAGAVVHPRVYKLPENSRIKDALKAAGGLRESANRTYVAKQVNLAQKIFDGQKLYIPFEGEVLAAKSTDSSNSLIDINAASSSELDSLYGVGEKTAQKIIDNRPYSSIEDLQTKKILNTNVYEKIKTSITAN